MRLDAALVDRGLVTGRDRAKELIAQGLITVNGAFAGKAALLCGDADEIALVQEIRYVSRGGEKLEKALSVFPVDPTGLCALDIGASTGGFSQCLLQHGARKVYAVDVGHGQLAQSLREDPRVVNMEGQNVRSLHPDMFSELPMLAVCDASFISLKLIFPVLRWLLPPGAQGIFLVKPQFEAGRENVGKRGVVRDPKIHISVLEHIISEVKLNGFTPRGLTDSPIRGAEGNTEFLLWVSQGGKAAELDLRKVVAQAQSQRAQ